MNILENKWAAESASAKSNNQGRIIRTYSHKRLVRTNVDGNTKQVGDALGYALGQPFSNDSYALLGSIGIDRKPTGNGHYWWDVSLEYSTDATPAFENSVDPTKQRVKRYWGTTEQTLYIVRDRNGNLIVNGANQPFDGGIPVTMDLPTLTYELNIGTFSGALATAWSNSLNSSSYSGADAKTLRMKVTAEETFEGTFTFWKTKVEMSYFPLTWVPRPINAGLYQLISGQLARCRDRDRQDATSPMPLYADGSQIPVAALPGDSNVIDVDWFDLLDYATLSSYGILPT